EYRPAGRPCKRTPVYDILDAKGAQWQEVFGWERVQYFSSDSSSEMHSFRRSNAFEDVGRECRGVRESVGIADLTAFAKFDVTGADAEALLDRLSANKMPNKDGGTRLVHMLTDLGGIESEMTITRFGAERFYLNSAVVGETHDLDWLRQHVQPGEAVTITDVTDDLGLLAISGPRSRDVLAKLTDADLSNDSFRWLTAQEIVVAGVGCRALRVSYVGELGWELHVPMEHLAELYTAIWSAGEGFGIIDYGSYAMNVMRIEKAYKAWGAELTTEITPVEADIGRFVDYSKDFKGKAATLERLEGDELEWILVYAEVDATDNDCRGNEPCYDGEHLMGITTSGTWGHSVGKSLAFAYVSTSCAEPGSTFEVQLMGERRAATVLAEPAYDPRNTRPRA
ncbi:MAG: aminomethyltransferase family protein, partial [Acidimicrobiales bacterium]